MKNFDNTKVSYILMNKDVEVLRLIYDTELHIATDFVEKMNTKFAPAGIIDYKFGVSKSLFNDWWKNRAIPSSRNHIQPFLDTLSMNNSVELLEKGYGLSLTDQYWLKEEGSSLEWKDINFFDNEFSADVGNVLFGSKDSKNIDLKSPDNSSDGNLQKKWKILNKKRCLVKAGNLHNNQEPYNEVIASKLGGLILDHDDYVTYYLIEEDNKTFSCCETMISTDTEFVAAHYIDKMIKTNGKENNYDRYLYICDLLNVPNPVLQIDKMIVFDYLLANYDRHWRNFGLIRDVNTLEWIKVAPLFDTGSSLWAVGFKEDVGISDNSKCFSATNTKQLDYINNLDWLNMDALQSFPDIVDNVLSQNKNLDSVVIDKIKKSVSNRIEVIREKQQELFQSKETILKR